MDYLLSGEGSFFLLKREWMICRMNQAKYHPIWYRELYTIFYKTYDKRVYSSYSTSVFDLYTYQNAKKSHSVDNTVDNVDNPVWITHTVFVNKGYA